MSKALDSISAGAECIRKIAVAVEAVAEENKRMRALLERQHEINTGGDDDEDARLRRSDALQDDIAKFLGRPADQQEEPK